MRFLDLIEAKKDGREIPPARLEQALASYLAGDVPDYQMAALLMAIRWRGLSDAETASLTAAMVASGERYDFTDLAPTPVDKHSTGGVGDKVSLPLAPLVAACGCVVPMISGRGLGHTGGTLDKLESIPGFRTSLDAAELRAQLGEIGVTMGAQTERFVPADRLLYALRDVTGTVDDTGLITASILSKKIAEGARGLVLDVKVGSGAFFGTRAAALPLADRLLGVAHDAGLACTALLTDMDQPVGHAIGNALEVKEAIDTLHGRGPDDLLELVLELGAEMLTMAGVAADRDAANRRLEAALADGSAWGKFLDLVQRQGGDVTAVEDPELLPTATRTEDVRPPADGYVGRLDARRLGNAAIALRAGRDTKEDEVDPGAGLLLHAKRGDRIDPETPWISLHFNDGADAARARALVTDALSIAAEPPAPTPLILERRT